MTASPTGDWRATRAAGFLRKCVSLAHYGLVLFVLFGWMVSNRTALLVHASLIPSMVIHWRFNHDRCIITNLENWLKYDAASRPPVQAQDPFIGRILGRIYGRAVTFRETQIWAHLLALAAWALGIYRLKTAGASS